MKIFKKRIFHWFCKPRSHEWSRIMKNHVFYMFFSRWPPSTFYDNFRLSYMTNHSFRGPDSKHGLTVNSFTTCNLNGRRGEISFHVDTKRFPQLPVSEVAHRPRHHRETLFQNCFSVLDGKFLVSLASAFLWATSFASFSAFFCAFRVHQKSCYPFGCEQNPPPPSP